MQYVITNQGEIVRDFRCLAEAKSFISRTPVSNRDTLEVITEEEKMYRAIEWCKENGYEYTDLLEDEIGEFVFEEKHNYANPSDSGASVDTERVYVNYKAKKTLEEAIAEMTS